MKNKYAILLLSFSLFIFTSCGGGNSSNTTTSSTNAPITDTTDITPSVTVPQATTTTIDVLVLYDKEVENMYANVSSRVNHLFAVSNNIYKDSQLKVSIHAKKILFYDAKTFPALREIADSVTVQLLREQYSTDTVLIYQVNPDGEIGLCGTAYSAGAYDQKYQYKEAMYAHVAINCPSDSTAHEIGHNMGLGHSHKQDGDAAQPFSYGLGHGINEKFTTIMAYPFLFNTENLIAKFSSPEYECIPGFPCGIPVGQHGEAHATKVIQLTAPKISEIYP
jgi:peptidyl-Asp metalloendopeptidase